MTTPQFIQLYQHNAAAVAQELLHGLSAPQAFTSPKCLYDALGSRLFEAITELPEYDLTRTEAQLMRLHSADMARHLPTGACWIDLGAGNCEKAGRLLGPLQAGRYVAVDISVDFVRQALDSLQRQHPGLPMTGLGTDFSGGLDLPDALGLDPAQPRVLFYPGSSIGNFTPDQALDFLQSLHRACGTAPGSGCGGFASVTRPAEQNARGRRRCCPKKRHRFRIGLRSRSSLLKTLRKTPCGNSRPSDRKLPAWLSGCPSPS